MREINVAEFEKRLKEQEIMRKCKINMFQEPGTKTIKRLNKYHRRNVFNLGVWRIDWSQLVK